MKTGKDRQVDQWTTVESLDFKPSHLQSVSNELCQGEDEKSGLSSNDHGGVEGQDGNRKLAGTMWRCMQLIQHVGDATGDLWEFQVRLGYRETLSQKSKQNRK